MPRIRSQSPQRTLAWSLIVAASTLNWGCGGGPTGASGYRLTSTSHQATLAPNLRNAWFQSADENTADIYLTDIDPAILTQSEQWATAEGHLVHIRMLLRPKPGSTPIEPTALTAAIVHIVLAGGQIGVYHGGGFMQPAGQTSGRTFGGSVRGGSMHLGAATPGFADRLGASRLTAGFRAQNDPDRVAEFRSMLAWALTSAPAVERRGVITEDEPAATAPPEPIIP